MENRYVNPSFETATTGASGSNMAVSRVVDAARAVSGTYVLKCVPTAGAGRYVIFGSTAAYRAAVTPNVLHTVSAHVSSDATPTVRIFMTWYTAAGAVVGGAVYGSPTQLNASPQRLSVSAVAPATAVTVRVAIIIDGTAAVTDILYVDGVMVNEGDLAAYADGSTPGWYWTGTPDASVSGSKIALTPDPNPDRPRIQIDVRGLTNPYLTIYRMIDGSRPEIVRGTVRKLVGQVFTIMDEDAPAKVNVTYQVREMTADGDVVLQYTSDYAYMDVEGTWISQPLYSDRVVRVTDLEGSLLKQSIRFRGQNMIVPGRNRSVYMGDGKSGFSSELSFATMTDEAHQTVLDMFGVDEERVPPVLCLRTTMKTNLPAVFYFSVLDVDLEGFNWRWGDGEVTSWTWSVEESIQQSPAVVTPAFTYADLEAAYASGTYLTIENTYATYAAIESDYSLEGTA